MFRRSGDLSGVVRVMFPQCGDYVPNLPYLLGPPVRLCWVKGEWQEALEGVT